MILLVILFYVADYLFLPRVELEPFVCFDMIQSNDLQ